MKRQLVKALSAIVISSQIISMVKAQTVGGGRNPNQGAVKDVKASSLSSSVYNGDVNLFKGGYGSSYSIGGVSTTSGLSFNLNMAYSPSTSVGDNMQNVSGILYGEGWNLELPKITITNETEYTISKSDPGSQTGITSQMASDDSRMVWMTPYISIPGVFSGEFVLKSNSGGKYVFIPNKFSTYIEAVFNGQTWVIKLTDGTIYEFAHIKTGLRNSRNLRLPKDIYGEIDNGTESVRNLAKEALANSIMPKAEVLEWYCSKIYNSNHPGNQQIVFKYKTYGKFNFYKEISIQHQPGLLFHTLKTAMGAETSCNWVDRNNPNYACGIRENLIPSLEVYRDVILTDIYALYENTTIDHLELKYETTEHANMKNMLLRSQTDNGVTPKTMTFSDGSIETDELYNQAIVYSYGMGSSQNFHNWYRYHHIYSMDAMNFQNSLAAEQIDAMNPYKFGGNKFLVSKESSYPYKLTNGSMMYFNHSVLESPRLNLFKGNELALVPGDLYEIKTYLNTPDLDHPLENQSMCNIDINITTGSETALVGGNCSNTRSTLISNIAGDNAYFTYDTYISGNPTYKSETVFTTFNQALKWNTLGMLRQFVRNDAGGIQLSNGTSTYTAYSKVTSNLFVMPSIPVQYGGITVEIGPGNSDHIFNKDQGGTLINGKHVPVESARANVNYWNDLSPFPSNAFKQSANLPGNFGIGMPWHMTKKIYDRLYAQWTYPQTGIDAGPYSQNYGNIWFNNDLNYLSDPGFSSMPTLTGQSYSEGSGGFPNHAHPIALQRIELIRYGKNPYMLKEVNHYKISTDIEQVYEGETVVQGLTLINKISLHYDVKNLDVLNNLNTEQMTQLGSTCTPTSIELGPLVNAKRNIILLESIVQEPVNCVTCTTTIKPSTQFEYEKLSFTGNSLINPELNLQSNLNLEFYALSRMTNPLGGITKIEYYTNIAFSKSLSNEPLRFLVYSNGFSESRYLKGKTNVFQIDPLVKKISRFSEKDANTLAPSFVQCHEYEYDLNNAVRYFRNLSPVAGENATKVYWGFPAVTVYNPPLDPLNPSVRTKTVYEYEVSNLLLFGNQKTTKTYDANNVLLKQHDIEYRTLKVTDRTLMTGTENYPISSATPDIPSTSYPYWKGAVQIYLFDGLPSYHLKLLEKHDTLWSNAYFIKKTKEVNKDIGATPNDFINHITEFDYWDANHLGTSSSKGFALLYAAYGLSMPLESFPSFMLFSQKSYSSQMPDAYQESHHYYYYDLTTKANLKNIANAPQAGILDNIVQHQLRNLVYQSKTIGKAPNLPPVANSQFFFYQNKWNDLDITNPEDDYTLITAAELPASQCTTPPPVPGNGQTDKSKGTKYTSYGGGRLAAFQRMVGKLPYGFTGKHSTSYGAAYDLPVLYEPPTQTNATNVGIINNKVLPLSVYRDIDNISETNAIIKFIGGEVVYNYKHKNTLTVQSRNFLGWPIIVIENNIRLRYEYEKPRITHYKCPGTGPYVKTGIRFPHPGKPKKVWYTETGINDRAYASVEYIYDNSQNITSVKDKNGKTSEFSYDEYNRLIETHIKASGSQSAIKLSETNYHMWPNDHNQSFNERAAENYVKTTTYLSTIPVEMIAYLDPLEREFRSVQSNPTSYVQSGAVEFDTWNRKVKQYLPFSTVNENPASPPLGTLFTENLYEANQRSRLLKSAAPGVAITSSNTVQQAFHIQNIQTTINELGIGFKELKEMGLKKEMSGIIVNPYILPILSGVATAVAAGPPGPTLTIDFTNLLEWLAVADCKFYKQTSIDENGNPSYTYSFANGQVFAVRNPISTNVQAVTLFQYDQMGNVIKIMNPERQLTHYRYNGFGWQYYQQTPDGGRTFSIFDNWGNKVIEQDENALKGHDNLNPGMPYARYWIYDQLGRPVQQFRANFSQNISPFTGLQPQGLSTYLPPAGVDDILAPAEDPKLSLITTLNNLGEDGDGLMENFNPYGTLPEYQLLRTADNTCSDENICLNWSEENALFDDVPEDRFAPMPFTMAVDPRRFWLYDGIDPNWDEPCCGGIPLNPAEFPEDAIFPPTSYAFELLWVGTNNTINPLMHYTDLIDRTSIVMEKEWNYDYAPLSNYSNTTWCQFCKYTGSFDNPLTNAFAANPVRAGQLLFTCSYNNEGKPVEYVFYTFDGLDNLTSEIHQFNENGISSTDKGITNTIFYNNHNTGGMPLSKSVITHNNHTFTTTYQYDHLNRVTRVRKENTSLGNDFEYGLLNGLISTIYNSTAAIGNTSFTYDQRNRLVMQSNAMFTNTLYYDNNHPQVAGVAGYVNAGANYNGNINAAKFEYTNGAATNGFTQPTIYGYNYDGMNRLVAADACVLENTINNITATYGDETYSYDRVGNMLNQSRNPYIINGTTNNNKTWTFVYRQGNNRLAATTIADVNGTTHRNWLSDPNGNHFVPLGTTQLMTTLYGRSNMPFHLQTGNIQYTHYLYSINDQRIYKENKNNDKDGVPAQIGMGEYYLIDAGGQVAGIYNKAAPQQMEFYQYGPAGRIGSYHTANSNYNYYISDYLGNTRIVAGSNGTIQNIYDYYPYGEILRIYGGQQKFLSTGNERDLETDLDYRNARYSDAETGRFLSIDPLAAKFPNWSPFNYTENNPVNKVDPLGLSASPPDNYTIYEDGTIQREETQDATDNFRYIDNQGNSTDLGTYEKRDLPGNGNLSLITVPARGANFTNYSNADRTYVEGFTWAAILGAAHQYNQETGLNIQINQLNNINGGHSGHGGRGQFADIRYANINGNVNQGSVWTDAGNGINNYDPNNSQILVNHLRHFGFVPSPNRFSILTENATQNGPALQGTHFPGHGRANNQYHHRHHMHLQHNIHFLDHAE